MIDDRVSVSCSFLTSGVRLHASVSRSQMNRLPNVLIGSAAAEIAAHRLINFAVRGTWFARQQGGRGHDLAGLAVATLRDIHLDPGTLNRMGGVRRKTFDRHNGLAGNT